MNRFASARVSAQVCSRLLFSVLSAFSTSRSG